jgi:hypothetical protein
LSAWNGEYKPSIQNWWKRINRLGNAVWNFDCRT